MSMDIVEGRELEKSLENALLLKKMSEDSPEAVFSWPEVTTQERQEVSQCSSQGPDYSFARSRLLGELKAIQQDPPAGISVVSPENRDPMLWTSVLFWTVVLATVFPLPTKPDGSRELDSNLLKVTLQFDEDYPMKPPTVRCVDRLFHPSILPNGNISLDILQENQWSPRYDAKDILMAIQSMFSNQSSQKCPANSEAPKTSSTDK